MGKKFLLLTFLFINIMHSDTIKELNITTWKQHTILTPPKKACANCNFFISLPLQDYPYTNNAQDHFSKIIFLRTNIIQAYQEILANKNVLNCVYCHALDKIMPNLPPHLETLEYQNAKYLFQPLQNSYKIDIKDATCNLVDTLLFIQDLDSVELWVYTNQCEYNMKNDM